eukprot:3119798-Pyramimonas_sp.AAC.1
MIGCDSDAVEQQLGTHLGANIQVDKIRKAARLFGKGQHDAQAHATEAHSPVRVTRMAKHAGPPPGRPLPGCSHEP